MVMAVLNLGQDCLNHARRVLVPRLSQPGPRTGNGLARRLRGTGNGALVVAN
jgi:hypothetical protein